MRGSIKKRGSSSWSIVIDIGRDPITNKRKQKRVAVKGTKKDAEKVLTELLRKLDTGTYVEPQKMTLGEYLDHWLKTYGKPNLAPRTYESYRMVIEMHLKPALGKIPLTKLQPLHLQNYYSEAQVNGRKDNKGKGLSSTTVLYHHRILHKALESAVKWQLLFRNIADTVEPPRKERKEMNVLAESDIRNLLTYIKGEYYYMPVFLAITTGMRAGEILGLRWKDVNIDNSTISICQTLQVTKNGLLFREPKTAKSRRMVEISPYVSKILKQHQEDQKKDRITMGNSYQNYDLVCCLKDGSPINPGTLSSRFRSVANKLNLSVRFHDLRHSHTTLLLKQGVHPKIVSERLGHANIYLTLDTYSHVLPGMQKEAANKLDDILFGEMKNDE